MGCRQSTRQDKQRDEARTEEQEAQSPSGPPFPRRFQYAPRDACCSMVGMCCARDKRAWVVFNAKHRKSMPGGRSLASHAQLLTSDGEVAGEVTLEELATGGLGWCGDRLLLCYRQPVSKRLTLRWCKVEGGNTAGEGSTGPVAARRVTAAQHDGRDSWNNRDSWDSAHEEDEEEQNSPETSAALSSVCGKVLTVAAPACLCPALPDRCAPLEPHHVVYSPGTGRSYLSLPQRPALYRRLDCPQFDSKHMTVVMQTDKNEELPAFLDTALLGLPEYQFYELCDVSPGENYIALISKVHSQVRIYRHCRVTSAHSSVQADLAVSSAASALRHCQTLTKHDAGRGYSQETNASFSQQDRRSKSAAAKENFSRIGTRPVMNKSDIESTLSYFENSPVLIPNSDQRESQYNQLAGKASAQFCCVNTSGGHCSSLQEREDSEGRFSSDKVILRPRHVALHHRSAQSFVEGLTPRGRPRDFTRGFPTKDFRAGILPYRASSALDMCSLHPDRLKLPRSHSMIAVPARLDNQIRRHAIDYFENWQPDSSQSQSHHQNNARRSLRRFPLTDREIQSVQVLFDRCLELPHEYEPGCKESSEVSEPGVRSSSDSLSSLGTASNFTRTKSGDSRSPGLTDNDVEEAANARSGDASMTSGGSEMSEVGTFTSGFASSATPCSSQDNVDRRHPIRDFSGNVSDISCDDASDCQGLYVQCTAPSTNYSARSINGVIRPDNTFNRCHRIVDGLKSDSTSAQVQFAYFFSREQEIFPHSNRPTDIRNDMSKTLPYINHCDDIKSSVNISNYSEECIRNDEEGVQRRPKSDRVAKSNGLEEKASERLTSISCVSRPSSGLQKRHYRGSVLQAPQTTNHQSPEIATSWSQTQQAPSSNRSKAQGVTGSSERAEARGPWSLCCAYRLASHRPLHAAFCRLPGWGEVTVVAVEGDARLHVVDHQSAAFLFYLDPRPAPEAPNAPCVWVTTDHQGLLWVATAKGEIIVHKVQL